MSSNLQDFAQEKHKQQMTASACFERNKYDFI